MGREKPPPDPPSDVPEWFMTYSDVVTLLMTFFILLLTFSTNEPERFERLQVTVFGNGGATGMAGPKPAGLEKDSTVKRIRPKASRMCLRGTEMPPTSEDHNRDTIGKSLAALKEEEKRDMVKEYKVIVKLQDFATLKGKVLAFGENYLRMLGNQLNRYEADVEFVIPSQKQIVAATGCCEFLILKKRILAAKCAVSISDSLKSDEMALIFRKHINQGP